MSDPVYSPSKLDGTEKIGPVPFDTHEQVVRGPHTHSTETGYVPVPVDEAKPEETSDAKEQS